MKALLIWNQIIKEIQSQEQFTLDFIHFCVRQEFKGITQYQLYFMDDQDDHIILSNNQVLQSIMDRLGSQPIKIFIHPIPSFSDISHIQQHYMHDSLQIKHQEKRNSHHNGHAQIEKIKIHNSICSFCKIKPIIGVRYQCGVCPQYNLCSLCQELEDHPHPLIKIKFTYQTPSKCIMQFPSSMNLSMNLSLKHPKNNENLIYESQQQKKQIIASYLMDLIGQQAQNIDQFVKNIKSDRYDMLFDEYMAWLQNSHAYKKNEGSVLTKLWRMFYNKKDK